VNSAGPTLGCMFSAHGNGIDPGPRPGASVEKAGSEGVLRVRLAAEPAAAGLVRDRVRSWLDGLRWPHDNREDVIAAVAEAVENTIVHAYDGQRPGEVEVTGHVQRAPKGMRQVQLNIVDHGRWRPPNPQPAVSRAHGFTIMRASMASVRIALSSSGTRVEMRSQPVSAS
jgi:anti-sigma regulatory factor (Ser/Thr protein kinase)